MTGIHKIRARLKGGDKWYYYAYRGGPKFWTSDTPVRENPAPRAFVREYERAMVLFPPAEKSRPNSVDWLIDDYTDSYAFRDLTRPTQNDYRKSFSLISAKWGKDRYSFFGKRRTRGAIKKWHHSFSATPRMADMHLDRLVLLLNHAVDQGLLLDHCAHKIKRLYATDRSDIIWTPEEQTALYEACTQEHTAYTLRFIMATGLRREAATLIPRTAIKDGWIEWGYGRGRKRIDVAIPITKEIREILDWFNEQRNVKPFLQLNTICFSSRFRPWTPDGLSTSFQKARKVCGVNKRIHDMKGTAATNYRRAGFEPKEIAGFVGWKIDQVEKIIDTYVNRPAIMRENVIRMTKK